MKKFELTLSEGIFLCIFLEKKAWLEKKLVF